MIGDRVRTVRELAGVSMYELSLIAKLSKSLVRMIERGKRTRVRVETLQRIATATGD